MQARQGQRRSAFFSQPLEPRRLLSTSSPLSTYIDGHGFFDIDNDPNVSVSYATTGTHGIEGPNGEVGTVTATVTGLPAHTMISVLAQPNQEPSVATGDSSVLTITAAGKSKTYTRTENAFAVTGNLGSWTANDSSTLTVTYSVDEPTDEAYDYSSCILCIAVYQPTVSISGGGSATEDSGTPLSFNVGRDLPEGYSGTSSGDDAIPNTTVNLSDGGTASTDDYTGSLPTSVTLTTTAPSQVFSVVPVWDDLNSESDETVVMAGLSGNGYDLAPQQGTTATIQNTAKLYTIDLSPASMNVNHGRTQQTFVTVKLNGVAVKDKTITFSIDKPLFVGVVNAGQGLNGSFELDVTNKGANATVETVVVTVSLIGSANVQATLQVTALL